MTYATAQPHLNPFSVQLATGSIRSFEGGEGEPVVLLHGLGGSAANWSRVAGGLAGRRRVIALDLPGHGGSDPLPAGASVDDYADAVAAVIQDRVGAAAVVAGHSFGGQVALRLAVRHPHLVRGLLLVVSSGVTGLLRRTAIAGRVTTVLRPGRLLAPLARRYAARTWLRTIAFRPFLVADAVAFAPQAVLDFFADVGRHRDVRGAFRALRAETHDGTLELHCPAVVLWGADDAIVPAEHGVLLARLLHAPLRVVADCGHLVIGERPDAVLDSLDQLLAVRPGSRPR